MTISRKVSKERTRARLLQGTLKVLHKEGPASLTTGRIAESAGVAQPTFYVHFHGLDDALKHVAEHLAERWTNAIAHRRAELKESPGGLTVRGLVDAYASALLEDAKAAEVFLRHRRDSTTAFGRDLRRLVERGRAAMVRDLAEVGGVSVHDLASMADLCLGAVLSVVEGVLDRRAQRAIAIEAASRMIEGVLSTVASIDSVVAAE